jgi:hypothetical protein
MKSARYIRIAPSCLLSVCSDLPDHLKYKILDMFLQPIRARLALSLVALNTYKTLQISYKWDLFPLFPWTYVNQVRALRHKSMVRHGQAFCEVRLLQYRGLFRLCMFVNDQWATRKGRDRMSKDKHRFRFELYNVNGQNVEDYEDVSTEGCWDPAGCWERS